MENRTQYRRAVLVGVCTGNEHDFQVGMEELAELAKSCGYEPARKITQHLPWEDKSTCAGPGKVEEIDALADAEEADLVIFNNSLSPAQISNLTKLLDAEVMDRTGLILQIFAEHATSREARLQVEYARLQYMLPRLVGMRRNLSRQGGGSGSVSNRGSGEMQIELDRRHIERKMSVLRKELKKVSSIRETQRKKRTRNRLPLVSLVGYTNAGKSTLMNALIDYGTKDTGSDSAENGLEIKTSVVDETGVLSGEPMSGENENSRHVYTQDMVFATLDTAVRRIEPEGAQAFLLSDTVGFINDLPTALVEAFHSTLEEVLQADLILNVVDASDPEHDMHRMVTEKTLQELGAGGISRIEVMNKTDRTDDVRAGTVQSRPDRIYLSAKSGQGIEELVSLIEEKLNGETVQVQLLIPFSDLAVAEPLHRQAVIDKEEYTEEGLKATVRMDMELLRRYKKYVLL